MDEHRSVEQDRDELGRYLRTPRYQHRREIACPGHRFGAQRRARDRQHGDHGRSSTSVAAACGADRAHEVIIPQRTTVIFSSRWNNNFSSAKPSTPITKTPASITSVEP